METYSNTIDPAKDDYFENFCGACDNFMTIDCPFIAIVNTNTKWKTIGCESFWDYFPKTLNFLKLFLYYKCK